jgi:hypothetical protein
MVYKNRTVNMVRTCQTADAKQDKEGKAEKRMDWQRQDSEKWAYNGWAEKEPRMALMNA